MVAVSLPNPERSPAGRGDGQVRCLIDVLDLGVELRRDVALTVVEHDEERVEAIGTHVQLDAGGDERLVVVHERPATRVFRDAGLSGLDLEGPRMSTPGDRETNRGT
jgi:hypothetical protein